MPKVQSKETRPYTASALLNDKPQFRIMTPNLMSTGGKQSLGDLLSDDQYKNELRQLEVVDDISEDNLSKRLTSLDRFVSANSDYYKKQQVSRHSALATSKRPMTSAASGRQTLVRPQSTISLKRPISGHSQLQTERFFTRYNKEAIQIDEIPYEELLIETRGLSVQPLQSLAT